MEMNIRNKEVYRKLRVNHEKQNKDRGNRKECPIQTMVTWESQKEINSCRIKKKCKIPIKGCISYVPSVTKSKSWNLYIKGTEDRRYQKLLFSR